MGAAWAAALVLLVALSACSGASGGPAADRSSPAEQGRPRVTLSFTQLLPDEGTERGLLRVRNTADEPLHVTGIGLDWPGYGSSFRQDKDALIGPDATMDLRLTLPAPQCEATATPIVGLVESDAGSVQQPLLGTGEDFLRRLWTLQCSERLVSDALDLRYGDRWTRLGSGAGSSIRGTLELRRRRGDEPVRLLGVQGSVLYDVALPGGTLLPAGRAAASLPIEILPGNRCDEHARGQATAPFVFRLELTVGDSGPVKVIIEPPPRGQDEATALLDRACAS
ncbi:hypothetical protein [Nocardioides mesophilus]|uniref:Lipoprotein n=1 Tax=Nocardioides mesophilus TaxID=433659 RepID=A0A7G9RCG3_9ACTN|nr:hypothetical protein [Nocardioides mesophilus]QNN53288.1 hypothetical protein H9L09_02055 [Nocardioides mesophilus]